MANGFGFTMRYTVNFEHATADFDLGRKDSLLLQQDGQTQPIACEPSDGWMEELRYFVQSVASGRPPQIVTADDAVQAMKVVDVERQSIRDGAVVLCR